MNNPYYKLAPEIKVREESFGLLFYHTKSTRLTFIESGRLIPLEILEKESRESDYLGADGEDNQKIKKVLENLVKRGLMHAEKKPS